MTHGAPGSTTPRRGRGRIATALLVLALGAACGRGGADAPDDSRLTTDGGDVEIPALAGPGLAWTITSEDYRKWMVAEGALASIGIDDLAERIPLEAATDVDIEQVAERLERQERIRAAIESAGLSVEEYVRTTVALEQALSASDPDSPIRFRGVPQENIIITDRHHDEVERLRDESPVQIASGGDDHRKKHRRGKAKGHHKRGKD